MGNVLKRNKSDSKEDSSKKEEKPKTDTAKDTATATDATTKKEEATSATSTEEAKKESEAAKTEDKEEPKKEEEKTTTEAAATGTEKAEEEQQAQAEQASEEPKTEEKTEAKTEEAQAEQAETAPAEEEIAAEEQATTEEKKEELKEVVVTRKEINEMSEDEQNRFMDAVLKMCENKEGVAGTSEYFRLASYHGGPGTAYCFHGVETFPGWHRIYLMAFEKQLQIADRALGRDGNIGLPYWNWLEHNKGLPEIARKRFGEFPEDLFPKEAGASPLRRNDDARVAYRMQSYNVVADGFDCLKTAQHFAHACTGYEWASSYPSVEKSHNSVHVIVGGSGGQMSSLSWAAFDICFWLHHCNVDRLYESYLAIEKDSHDEFRNFQRSQKQKGKRNRFEEQFEPFRKPDGSGAPENEAYFPRETFDTAALGFVYDKLVPEPGMELREPPTLTIFNRIHVLELKGRCLEVHVWLVDKDKKDEFVKEQLQPLVTVNDPEKLDSAFQLPGYAGSAGVFGRDESCSNCHTREPYDLVIDVTKAIREAGLSRYRVVPVVFCNDCMTTDEVLIPGSEIEGLPVPVVTGPLFEDKESGLDEEHRTEQQKEEVTALQRYLERFGYYADAIDGDFGPITNTAVKEYQTAAGLEVDGLVGPITKAAIMKKKRCENKDGFASNEVKDEQSTGAKIETTENVVKYSVGVQPGYMSREATLARIDEAFAKWAAVIPIKFELVESSEEKSESEADIALTWGNESAEDGNVNRFDGPGGVLGKGGPGYVTFDIAERWATEGTGSDMNDTSTWVHGQPAISLHYTALHEIGHALGLEHSMSSNDVMGPFYNPKLVDLSKDDISRIQAIYGEP